MLMLLGRRAVVVLESLQLCELKELHDVQPGPAADFVLNAPGGLVEDRRPMPGVIVLTPHRGLLPPRRDVFGPGSLPPGIVKHRPQFGGDEAAFVVELGAPRPRRRLAVELRLDHRLPAAGDHASRGASGGEHRELQLTLQLLRNPIRRLMN